MKICEFVEMLGSRLALQEDIWQRGRSKGWLDAYQQEEREAPLEKRTAAAILHEFLKGEICEPDQPDWGEAVKLLDLYDCRTCVNHVAQMYVKGIMEAREELVFGMRNQVTEQQAEIYIARCYHKDLRLMTGQSPVPTDRTSAPIPVVQRDTGGRIIDVRSREAYLSGHLQGAISIPLASILDQPSILGADREAPIRLYCESGYRSEIAANCLREAGYQKIEVIQHV